jgi:hypothetical protein
MLLLAAIGLTACSLHPVPWTDPEPRSFVLPRLLRQCIDGFRDPQPVELLDLGAEPHRSLRLLPQEDTEARLSLVDEDGGALAVEHVLEVTWDATGAQGQACYRFRLVGALGSELEDESGPVMGVIGVGKNGAITVGTDALDDASYDVEGELIHRIGGAQALLPTEPVGVGARWRFATEGHLRGEYVEIEADYRLVRIEGSRLTIAVRRHLRRPAQTVRGRKGEGERVDALEQTRRGVVEVDLRQSPLPTARWFDEEGREVEQVLTAWRR